MLPNSVTVGEKSTSSAIVAALMNFIVIIGVRKTAISLLPPGEQLGLEMSAAGSDQAGNLLRAKRAETRLPLPRRQTLQVGFFRRAQDLHALFREITVEPGEGEAGAG